MRAFQSEDFHSGNICFQIGTLLFCSIEYNECMYEIKALRQFVDWISQLNDLMTRARLVQRLEKAKRGLHGDVAPVSHPHLHDLLEVTNNRLHFMQLSDTSHNRRQ